MLRVIYLRNALCVKDGSVSISCVLESNITDNEDWQR
jgi:hypothetical protein